MISSSASSSIALKRGWALLFRPGLERLPDVHQLGAVDFVEVGDVGGRRNGFMHPSGRRPPDAPKGDSFELAVKIEFLFDLESRLLFFFRSRRGLGGADILLGYPSPGACAPDAFEVYSGLQGESPDFGSGQNLADFFPAFRDHPDNRRSR
jgi:hypothetical protein